MDAIFSSIRKQKTQDTRDRIIAENIEKNKNNPQLSTRRNICNINGIEYDTTCDEDDPTVPRCPDLNCQSINIIECDGQDICQDCGMVIETVIDSSQEWRYYGADDSKGQDPSRCGLPTSDLLPGMSIGCNMGYVSGGKNSYALRKMRNYSYWNSVTYREGKLMEAFNNMTIMSRNAGISNCIIEEAKYMYKKVSEVRSARKQKLETMKAASILLACKVYGAPRNFEEIMQIFNIENNRTVRKSLKSFEEIWVAIELREPGGVLERLEKYRNKLISNGKEEEIKDIRNINQAFDEIITTEDITSYKNNAESLVNIGPAKTNITSSIRNNTNISNTNTANISNTTTNDSNNISVTNKQIDGLNFEIDLPNVSVKTIKLPEIKYIIEKLNIKQSDRISEQQSLNENAYDINLRKACIKLGFTDKITSLCDNILKEVEKSKYLSRHSPQSRVSGVIYYISEMMDLKVQKKQIADVCDVSIVTVSNCYKKLLENKELLELYPY